MIYLPQDIYLNPRSITRTLRVCSALDLPYARWRDGQITPISTTAQLPQEDAAALEDRDRKGAVCPSSNAVAGLDLQCPPVHPGYGAGAMPQL